MVALILARTRLLRLLRSLPGHGVERMRSTALPPFEPCGSKSFAFLRLESHLDGMVKILVDRAGIEPATR